jgi:hypothetical protein
MTMTDPSVNTLLDYGAVGLALMIIWKLLEIGKHLILSKKINNSPGTPALLQMPCAHDPLYVERIKRIDASIGKMDTMIAEGQFHCQWKDRDEVRDLMEVMRALNGAVERNTAEMSKLTSELHKTRNGHG